MLKNIREKIAGANWQDIAASMHCNGYAVLSGLLSHAQCDTLKDRYDDTDAYRKTVVMARHRFGLGEYKYFDYPLPELIRTIRTDLYPYLVPIANTWSHRLGLDTEYPEVHGEFLRQCRENGQEQATALILKYGPGGFNTLHQDLYGTVYFPIQIVLFLNEPGLDYTGGEFVMTQQLPRAQSKAMVLSPKRGDVLIFTTRFMPRKGTRGFYRAHMKHGVSEVREGERHTLGIIFHDAVS